MVGTERHNVAAMVQVHLGAKHRQHRQTGHLEHNCSRRRCNQNSKPCVSMIMTAWAARHPTPHPLTHSTSHKHPLPTPHLHMSDQVRLLVLTHGAAPVQPNAPVRNHDLQPAPAVDREAPQQCKPAPPLHLLPHLGQERTQCSQGEVILGYSLCLAFVCWEFQQQVEEAAGVCFGGKVGKDQGKAG